MAAILHVDSHLESLLTSAALSLGLGTGTGVIRRGRQA